jgi:DNA-directed RNA polymerase specialized sigma24 family protein
MIALPATPTGAAPATTVEHDRLDQMISQIAAGDRTTFRRLYAFMAMRVWHIVAEAPLCPADAVAVTRSTFLEVWYLAGAAARYDARDWIATITNHRVNDRLRGIHANNHHRPHQGGPDVTSHRQDQPLPVTDYDAHIHRELTALLGADGATIRTSPGTFTRIDNLDHALATIAAATPAATTGPQSTSHVTTIRSALHPTKASKHPHAHPQS